MESKDSPELWKVTVPLEVKTFLSFLVLTFNFKSGKNCVFFLSFLVDCHINFKRKPSPPSTTTKSCLCHHFQMLTKLWKRDHPLSLPSETNAARSCKCSAETKTVPPFLVIYLIKWHKFDHLTSLLFSEHQYCYICDSCDFCSKPEKALCDLKNWSKSLKLNYLK